MTPTYDGALAGIPTDEETVRRLDRAHVFHSWSAQAALDPLVVVGAAHLPGGSPRSKTNSSHKNGNWPRPKAP